MSVTTGRARFGEATWILGFVLWGAAYITARGLLELDTLGWWARMAIALAPVPLFTWVLWNVSRGIAQMDELERRIQLEALAFAFPLTLLLLMTLGLLELAIGLNPNDWSYRHVWPFVFIFYFGGVVLARWRYA
jgi:hypothetical protein